MVSSSRSLRFLLITSATARVCSLARFASLRVSRPARPKKFILLRRGCWLSRRENGKKGTAVRARKLPLSAFSMQLRFPCWCNKLLLIRPCFPLTCSCYVRVFLSLSFFFTAFSTLFLFLPHSLSLFSSPLFFFSLSLMLPLSRSICPTYRALLSQPPTSIFPLPKLARKSVGLTGMPSTYLGGCSLASRKRRRRPRSAYFFLSTSGA